jgi:hypothetical protein
VNLLDHRLINNSRRPPGQYTKRPSTLRGKGVPRVRRLGGWESNPENTELAVGVKQGLWVWAWIEMK